VRETWRDALSFHGYQAIPLKGEKRLGAWRLRRFSRMEANPILSLGVDPSIICERNAKGMRRWRQQVLTYRQPL
jgi:hypothetical protein